MLLNLVLLGGRHAKARLEVHDVVFVAAAKLADAYDTLRAGWFGDANHLHIDGWQQVHAVDGYQVQLKTTPAATDAPKLYFIHHGGYLADRFGEEHSYCLVVAANKTAAKQQAKAKIPANWQKPHADHLEQLDDVTEVSTVCGKYFVHLEPGAADLTNPWQNDYIVLS